MLVVYCWLTSANSTATGTRPAHELHQYQYQYNHWGTEYRVQYIVVGTHHGCAFIAVLLFSLYSSIAASVV